MLPRRPTPFGFALAIAMATNPQAMAQTMFSEDFTTTTFRDSANTTADWNTAAGELRLFPFSMTAVGSYNTLGNALDVAVSGDLAFVADNPDIGIYDISDPTNPTLLGSFAATDAAAVDHEGDLLYIAAGTAGLTVIDVTLPHAPVFVGNLNTPNSALDVSIEGDIAYVANSAAGLLVIDVSNPGSPVQIGSYNTPNNANGVDVSGDHCYVADRFGSGVIVLDVSDPTTPTLAGSIVLPGDTWSVSVDGDFAYVGDASDGFVVLDVSDPTNPTSLGSVDPGSVRHVAVSGDMIYAAGFNLVHAIDVSDPMNPTVIESWDNPGVASAVAVAGEQAFVADGTNGGLQVVKVRRVVDPAPLGNFFFPEFVAQDVAVAGDLALLAYAHADLYLLDISNPISPSPVSSVNYGPVVNAVAVAGDLALVGAGGLSVLDISDPLAPVEVGFLATSMFADPASIAIAGDHAYVADLFHDFQVFDVSDPTTPVLVGGLDTPSAPLAVRVSGDLAVVVDGQNLHTIDISDPNAPTIVASVATLGFSTDVAVSGDLAFVAAGAWGVRVYSIADPTNPVAIGSHGIPPEVSKSVAVSGDVLLVGEVTSGKLLVIDVSDPTSLTRIGEYDTPGTPQSIVLHGDVALTVEGGFSTYRIFQDELASETGSGRSIAIDGQSDIIVRSRLTTAQTAGVAWELSANAGTNWSSITADNTWTRVDPVGANLFWRSTHSWSPDVNPAVSSLTLEWLPEFAPITTITDVPDDQGGEVRIDFPRSGYDFADEPSTPVTGYQVYQRVDGAAARKEDLLVRDHRVAQQLDDKPPFEIAPMEGIDRWTGGNRVLARAHTNRGGTFPPGTWEAIGWVAATQSDDYLSRVTTVLDSTSEGTNWSVYLVTSHTTSPSVWFASAPDSGYSVDNIAPGVPANLAFGSPDLLTWDPAPETDFAYHTVYGSNLAVFDGSAVLIAETISTTTDVSANLHPYYHVTTLDHTGNESEAATVVNSAVDSPVIAVAPLSFAVHAPRPNPFRSQTTVEFDLPRAQMVGLSIYDVGGRRIRTLTNGEHSAGSHRVTWNGRADDGQRVSAGVYFARLQAEDSTVKRRLVLLR